MKPSILLYKALANKYLSRLEQFFNVCYFPQGRTPDNQQEFDAALATVEGIIGTGAPKLDVNAEFLAKAPKLRVASTISVGYDNYDVEAMNQRGVLLTHTPDVLTETTADAIFGLLMATARRIPEMDRLVKSGNWKGSIGSELFGVDIHHKTLGIIGMGRIGKALAKRGRGGFDMNILYTSRSVHADVEQQWQAERCELDSLLSRSDFVCVILPLSKETYNLIDQPQLALMKADAILINGARGPIVNEQALISALKSGQIRAAGLDVYNVEPLPATSELLTLDNLVTLPHIGSATAQTRDAMTDCAVENLIAGLQGTLDKNCVNSQAIKQK